MCGQSVLVTHLATDAPLWQKQESKANTLWLNLLWTYSTTFLGQLFSTSHCEYGFCQLSFVPGPSPFIRVRVKVRTSCARYRQASLAEIVTHCQVLCRSMQEVTVIISVFPPVIVMLPLPSTLSSLLTPCQSWCFLCYSYYLIEILK